MEEQNTLEGPEGRETPKGVAPKGVAPKGGALEGGGPEPRKSGAPKGGAPKGGWGPRTSKKWEAPKGGAPKGGAPKGWGGPKFRAFSSLSRHRFRSFCVSLGGLLVEFLVVFEAQGP